MLSFHISHTGSSHLLQALLRAIEVLKAEVYRQRREKEELEAAVREQVCSEMMEVIVRMEKDFRYPGRSRVSGNVAPRSRP